MVIVFYYGRIGRVMFFLVLLFIFSSGIRFLNVSVIFRLLLLIW